MQIHVREVLLIHWQSLAFMVNNPPSIIHINIHGWWGGPAPKKTHFWQNLCFRATLEHFCSFTKMYDFSESSFSTNTTALLLFFQFIRFIPKLVFEEH